MTYGSVNTSASGRFADTAQLPVDVQLARPPAVEYVADLFIPKARLLPTRTGLEDADGLIVACPGVTPPPTEDLLLRLRR